MEAVACLSPFSLLITAPTEETSGLKAVDNVQSI